MAFDLLFYQRSPAKQECFNTQKSPNPIKTVPNLQAWPEDYANMLQAPKELFLYKVLMSVLNHLPVKECSAQKYSVVPWLTV